ncbi:hypothetical protein CDH05_02895 [Pseudomonas lactis]|nr:hypothetical protein CDH05_02895 [Pseudomonas lactis]
MTRSVTGCIPTQSVGTISTSHAIAGKPAPIGATAFRSGQTTLLACKQSTPGAESPSFAATESR